MVQQFPKSTLTFITQTCNIAAAYTLLLFAPQLALATEFDSRSQPESQSKAKLVVPNANKIENGEAIDTLITNANLRALSGSASRWSFASQWNYLGGTVGSPFSQDRPNISDASATTPKTDIDGALNIKYNLDVQTSLLAGFGVRWISPFTPGGPTNYSGTTYDAINPTITLQRLYRYFDVQAVLQLQALQYTQSDSVGQGYAQQFMLNQENIYEISGTGISIGGSTGVSISTFSNDDPSLASNQSRFMIWADPYIEYKLSDRLNLRTVVNAFTYELYRSDAFVHDTFTESVGFGVSVTRDIFLYPNVQFAPAAIASNRTNVGLAATLNLF